MSDYKYEEFYLLNDNKEHPLSVLQYISDEEYIRKYDGNMYCPLCKKAQLSRVRRKSVFLRTNHGQKHGMVDGNPCEYAFERKSVVETEEIIRDLKNCNRLGSRLDSVMLQLKKKTVGVESLSSEQEENRPVKMKSESSGITNTTRTVIPKYSFLNWGITTPQDHLIIAYGCVYVAIRQTKEGYYYLTLYADDSRRRLLTSFYKPSNIDIAEGFYNIVAVGTCKQNGKYYNFKLFDSYDGLRIEAVRKL